MCSQCEDVTEFSSVDCVAFPVNTTIPDGAGVGADYPTRVCSIVSPHGYGPTEITLHDNRNGSFRVDIPQEQVWSLQLYSWADDDLPYPASAIAYAEVAVADKEQYYGGYPVGLDLANILQVTRAAECTLRLCERTYNVTVSNGAVTIEKGAPNLGAQFWVDRRNGSAIPSKHPEWDLGSAFLRANYSTCWRPADGPAVKLTQTTNTTWVNEAETAFCPVSEFVAAGFVEGERRASYASKSGFIAPEALPDPSIRRIRTVGLEAVMSRIAASYTKRALLASNTTVEGAVYIPEVYVSVEWFWILHPAALTALALVFLVATIFVNHCRRLKLWKTSILAVLYHGLTRFEGEDEEAENDRHGTVSRMEKTSRGVRVELTTVDEKRGLMLD
jgi:hypothetical protein